MNAPAFDFESKTPAELYARREELQRQLLAFERQHGGIESGLAAVEPQIEQQTLDLLREMAFLTSTLRRKNAGPPKAAKQPKTAKVKPSKQSADELLDLLTK